MQLCWTDIDSVNNSVRVITPEKGSNPRNVPISTKLVNMLKELPKTSNKVFNINQDAMRKSYQRQRKRIACKLKNPRITLESHDGVSQNQRRSPRNATPRT